jgi:predicted alternative tryptophan synthase beta-subunit
MVLRAEGFLPAPESCHALAAAVDLARRDEARCIVACVSGSGLLDLGGYIDVLGL